MRTLRYVICDVFTDQPLTGNQLAVFTDGNGLGTSAMQALAREMGFSESVFLFRPEQGGHAKMRIFTPREELPFAGHPILGTAFVLAGPMEFGAVRIETGVGIISVQIEREGARVKFGWMSQPLPKIQPFEQASQLLSALGVERSLLPIELYDNGAKHVFVTLAEPAAVASITPDFGKLRQFDVGINVFAGAGSEWKTRMFAPAAGILEDAATGSAAGPLAVHLARHGKIPFGEEIRILQGVEIARPSELFAKVIAKDEQLSEVHVGGSAVIVARGEFRLML